MAIHPTSGICHACPIQLQQLIAEVQKVFSEKRNSHRGFLHDALNQIHQSPDSSGSLERFRSDQLDFFLEKIQQRVSNTGKQVVFLSFILERAGKKLGQQLDQRTENVVAVDILQRSQNFLQQTLCVSVQKADMTAFQRDCRDSERYNQRHCHLIHLLISRIYALATSKSFTFAVV